MERVVETVKGIVGDGPTYLTFDIDALDPAFAPGTGTPVWGGLAQGTAAEGISPRMAALAVGLPATGEGLGHVVQVRALLFQRAAALEALPRAHAALHVAGHRVTVVGDRRRALRRRA